MSIETDTDAWLRKRLTRTIRQFTCFDERLATQLATEIVDLFFEQYQGERIYISQPRNRRDAEILAAFDGTNRADVCRRYGISERTLYRILNKRTHRAKETSHA